MTSVPFRADHVGSLLRPERLHEARSQFNNGQVSASELREVETEEIKRIVDKQIEVGLKAVTDGEFRRSWWHIDFLENLNGIEGYVPKVGYNFHDEETEAYDVRNIGKISFNQDHPFLTDFKEFNQIVNGRAVAKQTIPSPNQLFHAGIRNPEIYPTLDEYAKDVIQTYRDALKAFYQAGVRYIQFDDVYIAGLNADSLAPYEEGYSRQELIELALHVANSVLENKPEDLYVTTHLCRGNYKSTWAFKGSYAEIAPTLFAKENVDGFFLEYDDERSGSFKPLEFIPNNGPRVVLGVITSKRGELENKDVILTKIKEASQFIPLEQICISPQCGFASTHHGNKLTEEEQWRKLKFIVDISEEIWGK
ncbi:5-methyltetrahydropteroyltriglutamate--homocysteine S-methyltransferase [Ornithinibacillus halophilus]|uniref:Methionine synthase II (Cobalamin-independent) n=1 Tax=Ornithinibacillus halophilus TaxID=930117 RepID=A0A1M5HTB4_9BACI|nr:5-methyltetrahydropteroyltriglutamate--homocysteine S-methyltransferase [Ornithinibacillus halophilus]SHG19201.1 Methionine synthase II (cobalamin-independent) [Ornithinibacillus halophilus]